MMRTARLPARTLTVAPANNNGATGPMAGEAAGSETQADAEGLTDPLPSLQRSSWPLIVSNIVFALAAVAFMLAWLRSRQQHGQHSVDAPPEEDPKINAAFHTIRRACAANDPAAARHSVDAWSKVYWQLPYPASREEIASWTGSSRLASELEQLDEILYGNQPAQEKTWQGNDLWQALVEFKRDDKKNRQQQDDKNQNNNLAPLYPNQN